MAIDGVPTGTITKDFMNPDESGWVDWEYINKKYGSEKIYEI